MSMSRARISWVLAGAALAVGALGGAAVAGGGPNVSRVSGVAVWGPVTHQATFCTGENGQYWQDRSLGRGTMTSTEPRLTGNLTILGRMLSNLDTGDGLGDGTMTVTDPATGDVTARGSFTAVVRAAGAEQVGFMSFSLAGGGFAGLNFSLVQQGEQFVGEFGSESPALTADFAVTFNGDTCTAHFMDSPGGAEA